MTTIYDTVYPRFKKHFTSEELERNFTPTATEIELMKAHTLSTSLETQVGFMTMLKCYQCIGHPTRIKKIPLSIREHILKSLNADLSKLSAHSLRSYDSSKSRRRHIQVIRDYLKVSADKQLRKLCMKKMALQSSAVKENLADIINDILEQLVKENFEFPSFTVFFRLARAARKMTILKCYQQISELLSVEAKDFIEKLFIRLSPAESSLWNKLKQDPKNPTSKNVKAFINHLHELKKLREQLNVTINFIPIKRIKALASEAIAMSATDMKRITSQRRYCLAAVFIIFKTANAIDDLVSIFIRWMRKLQTDGKEDLDNYRLQQVSEVDNLIELLHKMLGELKSEAVPVDRIKVIENCVTQGIDNAINQCEKQAV